MTRNMPLVNNKHISRVGNGAGGNVSGNTGEVSFSCFVYVYLIPSVMMSRIGNPQAKFHVNPLRANASDMLPA